MTLSQVCCVGWCISLYFNGEPQTRRHIPRRQAQTSNVWVFTCLFIVLNVANKIQLQIWMQIKKFTSMAGDANNMKRLDMREMWKHCIAASQHQSVNLKIYCLWWKTNWLKNWFKIKAKFSEPNLFFFFNVFFFNICSHLFTSYCFICNILYGHVICCDHPAVHRINKSNSKLSSKYFASMNIWRFFFRF